MARPVDKGFKYLSANLWSRKVADENGTERSVYDSDGDLYQGGTKITATAAQLNGTAARSITVSSASTSGTTSVEPLVVSQTMTGAGGVGGRSRFQLDTNVALGGWSNALKGITVYGATGKTAGLGSAVCAELTLSAGTVDGTYAPLEIELNLGAGALTGTQTSLIYASVNGAAAGTFDDNGALISLNGVTIGANHIFQASAKSAINATHAMKIKVLGVDYFIPCHTSAAFGV